MANDDELKQLEKELKSLEEMDKYGSPEPEKKDNMLKLFRDVLEREDTTKTGNLNDSEIGVTKISTRGYLGIASYARARGLHEVAKYLEQQSHILTSTSMSRKGFFLQLIVTNIKKEQKIKSPDETKKKQWFNWGKPKEEQDET